MPKPIGTEPQIYCPICNRPFIQVGGSLKTGTGWEIDAEDIKRHYYWHKLEELQPHTEETEK